MIDSLDRERILSFIEADRKRIVSFAQSLVRIPSTNHPPTGDEKECALFIADRLEKMKLRVDIFTPDEVKKLKEHVGYFPGRDYTDRPNVVGVYKGSKRGKSLFLVAHTDVELPGPKELWEDNDPWSGKVKDGKLFGRGSGDDKSGIVAQITALDEIRRAGYELRGDVILCNVVDEEQGGGNGTLSCIIRGYSADAAINMDGTNLEIQIANLGGSIFEITVKTKEGCNDIHRTLEAMKKAYQAIQDLKKRRKEAFEKTSSVYHDSFAIEETIRVGKFAIGGKETEGALNMGKISGVTYILPGEEKEMVRDFVEHHFKEIVQKDKYEDEEVQFHWWKGRDLLPSLISDEQEIVKTVTRAYKGVTNREPVVGGGVMSDLYLLNLYGSAPALSFGIQGWGRKGATHQPNECVNIDDLITYVKITALTMMDWCGYDKKANTVTVSCKAS